MRCASFVRLASVVVIAWLSAQTAALAQSAHDIDARNRQALGLYNEGKYAEAMELAEDTLPLAEQELGAEHLHTLACVKLLGALNYGLGRYDDAEQLLKRAMAGYGKALGHDDPITIATLTILGALYQAQGRYDKAEPLLEQALAVYEKTLGPEHPVTLAGVNALGSLYQAQGRYSEAEPLYKRTVRGFDSALGPEHRDTLTSANMLGMLYLRQRRYGEAEPLLKRALAGNEKSLGPEHPHTLGNLNTLGVLYLGEGRVDEAEPLLKRAVGGYEAALGPEHPTTLATVVLLGSLYLEQGRQHEAEPLYKRTLAGFEKAFGPDHPATLASVKALGLIHHLAGRFHEAEPLLKRALAGYGKSLGPEHPDTLGSVHILGSLYRAQDRYSEAEPLLTRALQGRKRALGPEHPSTLTTASELGSLYRALGRHGEAKLLLERALAGYEKALGPEHPSTFWILNSLAELQFVRRDWAGATRLWRRSTAGIAERVRRGAFGTGPTGRTSSEAERFRTWFLGFVKAAHLLTQQAGASDTAIAYEMFQTAQWALGSEAARSLAQMAARGAKDDPALAALARERQDLLGEWQGREQAQVAALGQDQAKRNARTEAENRVRMAAIVRRIAGIDAELKDKFPDYTALANPAPLSIEEVQAQLDADEALVLFLDTPAAGDVPEETFTWVVTKTNARWVRSELGQAGLAREVTALRCGLDHTGWETSRCAELTGTRFTMGDYIAGSALPFDHARAHRLYTSLFGQVTDLIRDKHLLIVPSGPLTQLPFSVLVSEPPQTGENDRIAWLARDHAVTILPAVSSLKALRLVSRPSNATKDLIGFGNPLLNGPGALYSEAAKLARESQSCPQTVWRHIAEFSSFGRGLTQIETRGGLADPAHLRLATPLPETTDELCAVARSLGADTDELRLGARATETELKALSDSGSLAQYRILHFATHGAMAGELREGAEPGLILTPPDQATEEDDGYLSASEIAALKLDADWVILSACNTAAGSAANAEALSGLARAFIYAQTRALLVSHWYVDSQATVALVTAAMREIGGGEKVGRAEALRRAMLSLIDSGDARQAHPSRWAPFIVVGEGAQR